MCGRLVKLAWMKLAGMSVAQSRRWTRHMRLHFCGVLALRDNAWLMLTAISSARCSPRLVYYCKCIAYLGYSSTISRSACMHMHIHIDSF